MRRCPLATSWGSLDWGSILSVSFYVDDVQYMVYVLVFAFLHGRERETLDDDAKSTPMCGSGLGFTRWWCVV